MAGAANGKDAGSNGTITTQESAVQDMAMMSEVDILVRMHVYAFEVNKVLMEEAWEFYARANAELSSWLNETGRFYVNSSNSNTLRVYTPNLEERG